MKPSPLVVSRRRALAGSGALILSFALGASAAAQQLRPNGGAPAAAQLPESLKAAPFLDFWIRISADGTSSLARRSWGRVLEPHSCKSLPSNWTLTSRRSNS
jgi:hypothetical protein